VENYEAEFRVCREFDFGRLYSVSWEGMRRLIEFLEKVGARGVLVNVPAHIHRILVLVSDFSGTLAIRSVEVEVRAPGAGGQVGTAVVDFDELVNHGLLRGAFVALEKTGFVLDSLHVICRPVFRTSRLPRPNFAPNWCSEHPRESLFWYEYCFFARMTVESSALVISSTVRLVEDSLQSMFARISAAESFAKAIHPGARAHARARLLLDFLARLNELGHSAVAALGRARDPLRDVCHGMVVAFSERGTTRGRIDAFLADLIAALRSLVPLTRSLDDVGGETSRGLFEFQEREGLIGFLRGLDVNEISPEALVAARRKAKLPPPEGGADPTWRSTLIGIERVLASIDKDVERCLVSLQCYDAVRQVLEHRLAEAELLDAMGRDLATGALPHEDARARLLDAAGAKLVTDQEKFAFEFFFPEEYVMRRRMDSGEVVFFETTKVSEAGGEVVKEAS
jgi:hypothetical protein